MLIRANSNEIMPAHDRYSSQDALRLLTPPWHTSCLCVWNAGQCYAFKCFLHPTI